MLVLCDLSKVKQFEEEQRKKVHEEGKENHVVSDFFQFWDIVLSISMFSVFKE